MAKRENARRALVRRTGTDLLWAAGQVSMDDMRAQDENFDRDSRFGRELLFLTANTEWMRNTVEDVTLEHSRALDTTLEVHVDLREITHEAFWEKERMWLPVLVLPAEEWTGADERGDSFPIISVTDAGGAVRSLLPQGVVRRQLAAALAEIVLNIAVARWPRALWNGTTGRPVSTREQRLVLSSALQRVLSGRRAPDDWRPPDESERRRQLAAEGGGPRLTAVSQVSVLLERYLQLFAEVPPEQPRVGRTPPPEPERHSPAEFTMAELTARTAEVVDAFRDGAVVVVGVDREEPEQVLTVRVPARRLEPTGLLRWGRRHATVTVDLLTASSQTARDVRIALPPGLSCRGRKPVNRARPRSDIRVAEPDPLVQLKSLMAQVLPVDVPAATRRPLADLALVKVSAVRELMTSHRLVRPAARRWPTRNPAPDVTERLNALDTSLRALTHDPDDRDVLDELRRTWDSWSWLQGDLRRRTTNQTLSSGAVHLNSPAVSQAGLRPPPVTATATLKVVVSDSPLFSAARFAGAMSLGLIGAVLLFVFGTTKDLDTEVAAGALTIFSAIQATRVEYPDRTTLRGVLSASGYWLVVLSILPTVMLAVALAFLGGANASDSLADVGVTWLRHLTPLPDRGTAPLDTLESAAVAAFALQSLAFTVMWIGPASGRMSLLPVRGLQLRTRPTPDHRRSTPLQSSWWRTTTAEALRLGRSAHAYLTWDTDGEQAAEPAWWYVGPADAAHEGRREMTNILSLVRASTAQRSATFFVFRDEPDREWWARHTDVQRVPLRPDQLMPIEAPPDHLHVFVGVAEEDRLSVGDHALTRVMAVCAEFGLVVGDVQLPVPAPPAGRPGLRWARIQINVHAETTRLLARFLERVHGLVGDSAAAALLVQTGRDTPVRALATADATTDGAAPAPAPVAAEQRLDPSGMDRPTDGKRWIAVITAAARPGIEIDVLSWIGGHRRGILLTGLCFAVLHGTAVVMVLGVPDPAAGGCGPIADDLPADFPDDDVRVAERLRSREELGVPAARPMLRVYLRSRDRPGLAAHLMEALHEVLGRVTGESFDDGHLYPWYALLQVVEGGTARASMTLRMPPSLAGLADWAPGRWESLEFEVRRSIAQRGARAQAGPGPTSHLDSTVVKLELLRDRPPA